MGNIKPISKVPHNPLTKIKPIFPIFVQMLCYIFRGLLHVSQYTQYSKKVNSYNKRRLFVET